MSYCYPITLISLASRQVWPQILAVKHFHPERLILIHSNNEIESKQPAERLKAFFHRTGILPEGAVELDTISHDDFQDISIKLDQYTYTSVNVVANITGGNKLMASATLLWAIRRNVPCFYLERDYTVTRFWVENEEIQTTIEPIDPHITDEIDPIHLIRAQMGDAEVEREGETLRLKPSCNDVLMRRVLNGGEYPGNCLEILGNADGDSKKGDRLELLTAVVLLSLNVGMVRRSVRIKARSMHGLQARIPIAEFDLVFNYNGVLWLVDCKDRKPTVNLLAPFRTGLFSQEHRELLVRIEKQLQMSDAKIIKEDILHIRSMGGLMGRVVCVRAAELPAEVLQFAESNQVDVIRKKDLLAGWKLRLHPKADLSAQKPRN
jgi:hypothetical protein